MGGVAYVVAFAVVLALARTATAPFIYILVLTPELSGNETPMLPVIDLAVSLLSRAGYDPDGLVLLQPTSPQAAYLLGLVKITAPRRIVEVGRYKGGSTLVITAAMPPDARFCLASGHLDAREGDWLRSFNRVAVITCKEA